MKVPDTWQCGRLVPKTGGSVNKNRTDISTASGQGHASFSQRACSHTSAASTFIQHTVAKWLSVTSLQIQGKRWLLDCCHQRLASDSILRTLGKE